MKTVQNWVEDFSDRVWNITSGMLSTDENEAYLQELKVSAIFFLIEGKALSRAP
jgi:hypothetical protein